MTDDQELIRQQIEETREDLAEKVEAIRARTDVRRRAQETVRERRDALVDRARRFREEFAAPTTSATSQPVDGQRSEAGNPPAGARLRALGDAAAAAGWRQKVADGVAPRVAGSAPVSGGEVRAILGLVFLAMSALYVVRSVMAGLRGRQPDHVEVAQRRTTRSGSTRAGRAGSRRPRHSRARSRARHH